jgi:hypothetical protein
MKPTQMNADPSRIAADAKGVVRARGAHAREAAVVLPRAIKAKINQLAHRSAQHHEEMMRLSMLQTIEGMARDGVDHTGLYAALTNIEQAPPPPLTSSNKGKA